MAPDDEHPFIPAHVKENYEQVQAQTGQPWTWLADEADKSDAPGLAAWMRSKASGDAAAAREQAPKGRRAAQPTETA